MHCARKIFTSKSKILSEWLHGKRCCSNSVVPVKDLVERRNYLFSEEQKKQFDEIGRIEKITVEVTGPPEDAVLIMNNRISTPYDCCKHLSEAVCKQTPLALINNEILWDMHRPLPGSCKVKFLNFKDPDPFSLNKVFWRTGSFVLGAVISRAFRDDVEVYLHSFPPPYVKSGSFVYDVVMNLKYWEPNLDEMKILTAEFLTFVQQNHKIEHLQVKKSVALEIFEGNHFKQKQLSQIASQSPDNLITLYRVGNHIDTSCGPMVANTSFFGRCAVASVHRLRNCDDELFYRIQGVALPKGIMLNHMAFSVLYARAGRLNEAISPGKYSTKKSHVLAAKNSEIDVKPHHDYIQIF